jgi:serine/threonine protein phosphatase 1
MPPDLDELRQAVHECLPMDVEHWLGDLAPNARSGDVLFVHAGLNPRRAQEAFLATPWNRSLANLAEASHWAWIRRPFLDHEPGPSGWEGFFVVHGHTPNDGRVGASHEDQIRRFRLNLDGGSAVTGVAKMGIFRGAFVDVVTVQCGGHEPGATPVRPVRRDA